MSIEFTPFSTRTIILVGLFGHGVCLFLAAVVYEFLLQGSDSTSSGSDSSSLHGAQKKALFEFLTCFLQVCTTSTLY